MSEKKKSVRDAYHDLVKAKDSGQPTSYEEEKLLACLENYRKAWVEHRDTANAKKWQDQVAAYSGDHYVRSKNSEPGGYRVRLRENHLNNTMNRMLSVFIQNMPVTRVFPASTSHKDAHDAESTELYAKYFWRQKKLETKFAKLVKYSLIFGNGFMYRPYNPDLGGKLLLDGEESGTGDLETRHYKGDIEHRVLDPFKVAVRPGMESMDEMHDVIISEPTSKADLESKYGKIEADPAKGMNAYSNEVRNDDDRVMLHHYYHKPTPWFEEGLYVCWVGKKILKARDAADCEKSLPLVHLPFDQAPMSFWAMSSLEQVLDLQEQLNRAASMIVEARNLIARPRVFVSNEAKMPAQSLSDRPGDIMRYAMAGGKPEFLVPQFNFAEMAAHKQDVRGAIGQVTGMTGASRGEIPQATKTALALQLVLEQDRSQWAPFLKLFHQCILDHMQGTLETAAEYFGEEDPRVIKIEGPGITTTRLFHGGMVPSPLDLYLEDTNPLGWTAAGRVEQITTLVQMGVLKDRSQVLEMLKLNSPDPGYEMTNISRQAALKEIEKLNQGEMLDIGPEDDDAVHLDEHVKVVASFEYRSRDPQVKEAHERHIAQHKQRYTAAKAQQSTAPTEMQGGSPGSLKPEQAVMGLESVQPDVGRLLAQPSRS